MSDERQTFTNASLPDRLPNAGHLNYRGDHRELIGGIVGPNGFNEYLTAVTVDYNAETDRTRVGFDYARVDEVEAMRS